MAGVLAGADMLNMGGLLDALKVFDFAKAVIDDEIALMLKRVKRGFEFNEDNLALDVIADIGPGGSFMVHKHTMKRMKTTALLPTLADRDARDKWEGKGALDTQARALRRAREILQRKNSAVFPPEVDGRIRAQFKGLVPGDLEIPMQLSNQDAVESRSKA
jgi:trimethylamine--corrinoid protein Co-methyltransferase